MSQIDAPTCIVCANDMQLDGHFPGLWKCPSCPVAYYWEDTKKYFTDLHCPECTHPFEIHFQFLVCPFCENTLEISEDSAYWQPRVDDKKSD